MANNNKQQSEINLLKASFCRQHFPALMQFLRRFDISSTFNEKEEEENFENDFNMHFLLQAYNEEKIPNKRYKESEEDFIKRKEIAHANFITNQRKQKENCKWWLSDVNESDVLLAIEEYFNLVAKREDTKKLASILVNSIITEGKAKTLFSNNPKELYTFEDETTLCVLQHLNIKMSGEDTTLGIQRNSFARFLLASTETKENPQEKSYSEELCNKRPEVRFIQAFELLASIRNWTNHEYVSFLNEAFNSYCLYKYIIFTHIGLIYICRRLWNNSETVTYLLQNNQTSPSAFNPEPTTLKVKIRANNSKHTICNCKYSLDDEKSWIPIKLSSRNQFEFPIKVDRYQLFKIKFECEGNPYDYVGKLNYYAWEPILNIVVKPPKSVNYNFKGIAGDDEETEEYLSNIFTKCMESYFNTNDSNTDKDKLEKALVKLGELEPCIKELQELAGKNSTIENERKIEIRQKIIPQLKDISKDLGEVKNSLDWIKEFLLNVKYAFVGLFMAIAGCCFYKCYISEISTNIFWLNNKWLCITIALLLVYFTFRLLTNKWNLCKAVKEDGKMKYWITGAVALLFFASPFFLKYPNKDSLVKNYDFSHHESADNQTVASFLENSYEKNPKAEDVIIQLATYYLNYSGEDERAWEILQPLLNKPDVHKESLVTMAETYFAKGAYTETYDIVKRCKDLQLPAVLRLEGLLYATPAVNMLDYPKGDSLLKLAAKQGDTEALYWLGHLRSNAFGSWYSTYQGGEKLFSLKAMDYDLFASITFLRKAANKNYPKAALELGNIFLDLNLNDSAQLYLEKALAFSDRNIQKEVYYRLGLLDERRGDSLSQNMKKAIDLNHEPALLHRAIKSNEEAILYYQKIENLGGYKGYRYIPPIVFRRINKDLSDSILISLQRAHPKDNIDGRFVDAIEAVYSFDSVANEKGHQMMRSLSAQNKFAKMLTIYWDLKKMTEASGCDSQIFKDNLSTLESLGSELPFAYALAAYILKEMGTNYFDESDKFAQKAIIAGHPAGAVVLAYIPPSYFKKIEEEINAFYKDGQVTQNLILPWNREKVSQLIKIRNRIHLALRMSEPHWTTRNMFINYGQKIDYILYATTNDGKLRDDTTSFSNNYPEENLRFWSNVAMAINDFENEGWMNYQYHRLSNKEIGLDCRKQLLDSMLHCIFVGNSVIALPYEKQLSHEQRNNNIIAWPYINFLSVCKGDRGVIANFLSNNLSEVPESFRKEMMSKYGSDEMIKYILENEKIVEQVLIIGSSPMNGNENMWHINDKDLLEEWSAVEEGRTRIELNLSLKK